ncbi:MAG: transporter permease [Citricoccus sp.]|nr:transporter permease [Citricoccus sp. WCRC_4]
MSTSTAIPSEPVSTPRPAPSAPPPGELKTKRKHAHFRWSVPLGWVVFGLVLFGTWELCAATGVINPVYFGQPSMIIQSLFQNLFGELLYVHTVATFTGVIIGWILASVLGIITALALSASPYMLKVIEPYFTMANSLPRVALAPLFLLWFGLGVEAKIALAFSLAFFVVFSNTLAGVQSAESERKLLARVLGASKIQTFRKFVLPGAVPGIFTGLELGFIFGMLAAVAGEMLAGRAGLGVQLQFYANSFQMNEYFATLIILVAGTMLFSWLLRAIRRRLLRWQEATETE